MPCFVSRFVSMARHLLALDEAVSLKAAMYLFGL